MFVWVWDGQEIGRKEGEETHKTRHGKAGIFTKKRNKKTDKQQRNLSSDTLLLCSAVDYHYYFLLAFSSFLTLSHAHTSTRWSIASPPTSPAAQATSTDS